MTREKFVPVDDTPITDEEMAVVRAVLLGGDVDDIPRDSKHGSAAGKIIIQALMSQDFTRQTIYRAFKRIEASKYALAAMKDSDKV